MPIHSEELFEWSQPHRKDTNRRYYRPLVCKGKLSELRVLIVGQNPATPITRQDIRTTKAYTRLLHGNYLEFLQIMGRVRSKVGKAPTSRTRNAIDAFVSKLSQQATVGVAETNINVYPTWYPEELFGISGDVSQRGREVFWQVLESVQPRAIVLHGDDAIFGFQAAAGDHGLQGNWNWGVLAAPFRERKGLGPLAKLEFSDGKSVTIFGCEHLRFFGEYSDDWNRFIDQVLNEV